VELLIKLARVIVILVAIGACLGFAQRGRGPALPAPACGLVTGQVICYDMQTAAPRPLSPTGQGVIDFTIAPDGNWVAYRANNTVTVRGVYSDTNLQIDSLAIPPAALDLVHNTLTWSPDGLSIAYLIASGFRVAFPSPDGTPQTIDITDRLYINLRFSTQGSRLAAQAIDGNWSLFKLSVEAGKLSVNRTGSIARPADLAWFDDSTFVLAAVAGGLTGLDANDLGKAPAWTVPNEHFTKLFSSSIGQVFALHPDPGDTIGSAVSITKAGEVKPIGVSKIDSQVEWGPDGNVMLYITSGTPILVDRRDGRENILPLSNITHLIWAPPWPTVYQNVPVDADLYYIAADADRIRQVWRMGRSGLEAPQAITRQFSNVDTYALSPDKLQIALVSGGQLISLSLADSASAHLLALLSGRQPAQPVWRPDGQQIAYVDKGGLRLVSPDGKTQPRIANDQQRYPPDQYTYYDPTYSADGRYLLVKVRGADSQNILMDLDSGTSTYGDSPNLSLSWGAENSLLGYFAARSDGAANSGRGKLMLIKTPDMLEQITLIESDDLTDYRAVDATSIIFLRRLGWKVGPTSIQFGTVTADNPGSPQIQSAPFVLSAAQLSPTGRFAVGIQPIGTINQMVILDLQTGRKVRILGTDGVSSIQWSH
jgi:hypothetical protein